MPVQDLPGLAEAKRIAEQAKGIEKQVAVAAEHLRTTDATSNAVRLAIELTSAVRAGLNANVQMFNELANQNQRLRAQVEQLQNQMASLGPGDEPEDDQHFFGTHIREAWAAIRGR